jgi:antitoxin HicB
MGMAKARYRYSIMLRPEPEGGYTALVPALPGCVTYGRTLKEAQEMAKDAISGYIASLRKHNDSVPPMKTPSSLARPRIRTVMPSTLEIRSPD